MRSRITGFILFIVFATVFYNGVTGAGKIILSAIDVNNISSSTFVDNIEIMLGQIKAINKRKAEFSVRSVGKVTMNVRVFYLMISPKKEAGVYYNGNEYLVGEGSSIGPGVVVETIEADGIIINNNGKKYYISK